MAYKYPILPSQFHENPRLNQCVSRQEIEDATKQLAECIYNSVKSEAQSYTYTNDSSAQASIELNEVQIPSTSIEFKNDYKNATGESDFLSYMPEAGCRYPIIQDSRYGRQDYFGHQQIKAIPSFENFNFAFEPTRMQVSQPLLDMGFNHFSTANPGYTLDSMEKSESETELRNLANDEAIDPLCSDKFNSNLSGSSVLTFDNMSSISGYAINYSSHSSASLDSEVLMRSQDFENIFGSSGEYNGEIYNPLRQVNAASFPNQIYPKANFALDISPDESVENNKLELFGPVASSINEQSLLEVGAIMDLKSPQTRSNSFVANQAQNSKICEPKIKTRLMKSRNHKCPVCQKVFKRPLSFRIHYSIHTGEREYKCNWLGCGKLFNVKSNMTRHQKVHLKKLGRRR